MPFWLLESQTLDTVRNALASGVVLDPQLQVNYEASIAQANSSGPRILSTAGTRARVTVEGILTGAPDFFAKYYGGGNTTYAEIRNAIAAAEKDRDVTDIDLFVSSPGGEASSEWLATMEAIANATKPVHGFVGTLAASAAYGIISQATTITAQNAFSMVGSVGVMTEKYVNPSRVIITSTDAPNKRPDPATDEGKAQIRAELDKMHDIFAQTVAKGRKVDVKTVNTDFGRGGMMLAADAVKSGMIDSIQSAASRFSAVATSDTEGGSAMDLLELKSKHPTVYAQAAAEGVASERDRVTAHITMGEAFGSINTAIEAIKKGENMTATATAQYLAASANRTDTKARTEEDAAAAAALDASKKAADEKNGANSDDALAYAVAEELSVNLEE